MKFAPDIADAIDRFAKEEAINREEALAVIARDWLIGLGFFQADPDPADDPEPEQFTVQSILPALGSAFVPPSCGAVSLGGQDDG